jgi:hypothetical protein
MRAQVLASLRPGVAPRQLSGLTFARGHCRGRGLHLLSTPLVYCLWASAVPVHALGGRRMGGTNRRESSRRK